MKKAYITPKMNRYGSVENLTQQVKTIGSDDGIILVIPGVTPDAGVAIGSVGIAS